MLSGDQFCQHVAKCVARASQMSFPSAGVLAVAHGVPDDTLVSSLVITCRLSSKLSPCTSQILCKVQQAAANFTRLCKPVSFLFRRICHLPLRRPKSLFGDKSSSTELAVKLPLPLYQCPTVRVRFYQPW